MPRDNDGLDPGLLLFHQRLQRLSTEALRATTARVLAALPDCAHRRQIEELVEGMIALRLLAADGDSAGD